MDNLGVVTLSISWVVQEMVVALLIGGSTVFRKETTSALLTVFHVDPLSWSNWNLEMLVFVEGGKLEYTEKNIWSKARTKHELNPKNYGTRLGGGH